MELLQLKYFCDAAVSENFSETARKFFVPPSGISQSIGRLERELGCALFLHSGNKIRLNEEGRIFYRSASAALMLLAEGADVIAFIFLGLAGVNFLFELGITLVFTPAAERILYVIKKK